MRFGGSTVTLKHYVKSGTPDELGQYMLTATTTNLPNCRHRPLTMTEIVTLEFDVATQPWKTTIPIHEYSSTLLAALAAIAPDDVIEVDGQEYQIVGGVRPHPDLEGNPFKTTIISQKQIG